MKATELIKYLADAIAQTGQDLDVFNSDMANA